MMVLALSPSFSVAALKSKPAPQFPDIGAALNVSDWSFRKSVVISNSGPQQLELDLGVLSGAQRDFSDLRLMREGEQIPYLVDPATLRRFITPEVVATNDPHNPAVSRWIVHLPRPNLPVVELHCDTATPLFEREMTLYETRRYGDSGDAYQQTLAHEMWTTTPRSAVKTFTLKLNPSPLTDTLILEAHNGDNPPIQLNHFQIVYTATRIFFDARAGEALFLYYGNDSVNAPHYDLNLVSTQLRSVDKATAALGPEEILKKSWSVTGKAGKGGAMFWGILALVVLVLLVVIARLLPKSEAQPPK